MIRVVINADDFGLRPGINAAILDLIARGALSSTSAMVTGAAIEDGLGQLPAGWRERLGLHITLCDEAPAAPADSIPSLVCRDSGRLKPRAHVLRDAALGRISAADVDREVSAQYHRFVEMTGCKPAFFDGHGHLHVFPGMAAVIGATMRREGISQVRRPADWRPLVALSPRNASRLPLAVAIGSLAHLSFRNAYRGLPRTQYFLGLLDSGVLTPSVAEDWVERMVRRRSALTSVEVMCHPGFPDDSDDSADHYANADEHSAMIALKSAIDRFNGEHKAPIFAIA